MRIDLHGIARCLRVALFCACASYAPALCAQQLLAVTTHIEEAQPRGENKGARAKPLPAAVWLIPTHAHDGPQPPVKTTYTLLQKNKQFSPHLLVVPVGSVVHFPNADPFFHNVFSRFDGRRFDLGLYEAGSTREVTFGREGISYIFCNIHPEMSAVVIALSTPYYGVGDAPGHLSIENVPEGDYVLHVWVQGEDQAAMNALTRKVHVSADHRDLGGNVLPQPPQAGTAHENKFGKDYNNTEAPVY